MMHILKIIFLEYGIVALDICLSVPNLRRPSCEQCSPSNQEGAAPNYLHVICMLHMVLRINLILVEARSPALLFWDSQPLAGDAHSASII